MRNKRITGKKILKYISDKQEYQRINKKILHKVKRSFRGLFLDIFYNEKVKLPAKIRLEACTLCQLNCKTCYMRKGNYCGVGAGYLKYENFVKFLQMNPFVKTIELSNSGEIFLNPDLLKIIEYAYANNVQLSAENGVNFNTVSDEMLEALVKYKFGSILFSIDGASQETYSLYRRNGNFDTVINNIKKLNEYRKKYDSEQPNLTWQYIILETNDSELDIDKAKAIAKEQNMDIMFKKDWSGYIPKDRLRVEKQTGLSYADQKILSIETKRWMPCLQLWNTPQINWNGKFLACCCGYEEFDIDIFETGLEECLNSALIKNTKKMLLGGNVEKNSPCATCAHYRKYAIGNNLVKIKELKN
jgi:hypothetical protein